MLKTILDCLEAFLDEGPGVETVEFGGRTQGEGPHVLMEEVTVNGERYLVVVKRLP